MIDVLRDRRTLISTILLPMVMIPLMIYGMTKFTEYIMKKEEAKTLKIGLLSAPADFRAQLESEEYELIEGLTLESGRDEILKDSLDALIDFRAQFADDQTALKTSKVSLFYKSTHLSVKDRMEDELQGYQEKLTDARYTQLNISKKEVTPIDIKTYDIAPPKEKFGKLAGGFLPYMFIIFCFTGCMYPALDLITGEKERGTIETLLTVPASRVKIMLGKVITIALVGLVAAIMIIIGLIASTKLFPNVPDEIMQPLLDMVTPKFILMLLGMLIPLSFFFAGFISMIVIRAKSFKEAQSLITPFSFIIFLPVVMGLMPGIELNWKTVWIPIMNIALATKEIIAGTIQNAHYVAIIVSLCVIAIGTVLISFTQFSKEGNVLN